MCSKFDEHARTDYLMFADETKRKISGAGKSKFATNSKDKLMEKLKKERE